MKLHHSCTILRTFERSHGTFNLLTGEGRVTHTETVTEPCGVPLFSGSTQLAGVCQECADGWTHPKNTFASEAERNRAMASRHESS